MGGEEDGGGGEAEGAYEGDVEVVAGVECWKRVVADEAGGAEEGGVEG